MKCIIIAPAAVPSVREPGACEGVRAPRADAVAAVVASRMKQDRRRLPGRQGRSPQGGAMTSAWFSQVLIAAERLTRAMRYASARRATCEEPGCSRACSGMLACGLCAIGCREAGVPVDHAGAARGVCPATCFHPRGVWCAVRWGRRRARQGSLGTTECSHEWSTVNCLC